MSARDKESVYMIDILRQEWKNGDERLRLYEAYQTTFEQTADSIIGMGLSDNSWLKKTRKANGLTQEQLSIKSGVSIRLIRAYEQGAIKIDNAEYSTITKLKIALRIANDSV